MPNYYLVKSEPYVFSFADLLRDGRAMWDGVRNFEARNHLRAMAAGDLLLFYHSNEGKEVVGVAQVSKTAYADPTADPAQGGDGGDWSVVDVAPVCPLNKPVALDTIRGEPRLAQINLLRRNRLSVVPVTPAEFALILKLGETTLPAQKTAAKSTQKIVQKSTQKPAQKSTQQTAAKPTPKSTQKSTARARATRVGAMGRLGLALWLLLLAALSPTARAWADPSPTAGKLDAAPLLSAQLVDLEDRVSPLRSYYDQAAAPVLVVLHQDRKSAEENAAFKTEVGRLSGQHAAHLRVVALADVAGYGFWPAKGYVKDALRPLRQDGAVVLCDWQGAVRKQYGLRAGQSAVFVLSSSGELVALSRGKLSEEKSKELLRSISELLPASPASP